MSFSSYSTSRCYRSEDIHDVLLLSLLRFASAFFPAIVHLKIVFQPVRVVYVSVYTYINLDPCFNILYLIYFIKHIIIIQRNQISSNFAFKYLYTNQISVFIRSFLKSKLNLSTLISTTTFRLVYAYVLFSFGEMIGQIIKLF